MNDTTKEITAIFPEVKEVSLKGKTYIVKPYGFGQYPKLLKLIKDLKVGTDLPADAKDIPAAMEKLDVGTLMADNAEAVVDLCALALRTSRDFFDDLPGDEGVKLCQAVIEVNADFFVKRLLPQALEALSALTSSVGALSLQPSSTTVTH